MTARRVLLALAAAVLALDVWQAIGRPGALCPACQLGRLRWGGAHACDWSEASP